MFAEKIAALAMEKCGGLHLQEAIVGLGFTLVCLDGGACGLAYTLRDELERGCDVFGEAGRLAGREAGEVLAWIGSGSVVASAVGLAAANALLLAARIRHEEQALESAGEYRKTLAGRARLLPWGDA